MDEGVWMAHEKTEDANGKPAAKAPQPAPGISFHAWGMRNEERNLPPHVLCPSVAHAGGGGHHGSQYLYTRNEDKQPPGKFAPTGKFGRLFGELTPLNASDDALVALGNAMVDPKPSDPAGDNPDIPAGFTYFGQFVDHDVTFDTTSLQEKIVDPLSTRNFRTPALDLDCLYGSGRVSQPYLYERQGDHFLIGSTRQGGDPNVPAGLPNDLPRGPNKFALIGDPRNDENLVVQQLHLAFLKFHNKIVDEITAGRIVQESPIRKSVFDEARDLVIWHYQWIVLHDFVGRLCDGKVLQEILDQGREFYLWEQQAPEPYMPVEFSVAAYRLGHSMVREVYDYNRVFTPEDGGVAPAFLSLLFQFTGLSGNGNDVPTPSDWIIDWRRFFDVGGGRKPGLSRRLDPLLAPTLGNLPNVPPPSSLAVRNLLRGKRVGLPPGQSVARFMGFTPLDPKDIAKGPDGAVAAQHNLHVESPLWYYILKEAEIRGGGRRLGPVGSRIVGEVFIGLLAADASSWMARKPGWTPTLPSQKVGDFTMADLLIFVDDINPVG